MTYQTLIEKYDLKIEIEKIPFRKDIHQSTWDKDAKHFSFTLYIPYGEHNGKMIGFYSQGSGIKERPTTIDILNALRLDTEGIQDVEFESWANEYGYDTDSMKAFEIWKSCKFEAKNLLKLLGNKGMKELYKCEQL